MKENERYLRIETTLYKRTIRPSGEEKLTPWNMDTLKADYGNDRAKDIIGEMPKYDGWVNEPSHTDYQEAIGSWLNVYQPLQYQPQKGVGFPISLQRKRRQRPEGVIPGLSDLGRSELRVEARFFQNRRA